MLDDVITQVENMVRQEKANPGLMFLNWDCQPLDDLDDYYYDEDDKDE